VGVLVGVDVLVSVLILISVGVGVYVFVGGRVVGEGCGVPVKVIDVAVCVWVGCEDATAGGTSIPVNSSAVPLIPMKSPKDRYLTSARMVDGIFILRLKQGGEQS